VRSSLIRSGVVISVIGLLSATGVDTAAAATYLEGCNDHMKAPWVALYEHPNFGGANICIMGTGPTNLNHPYIKWARRASSINIGAEGRFSDGAGHYFRYHYGTRIADLRTVGWDDRFVTALTTG
jgi:hypothetical protein